MKKEEILEKLERIESYLFESTKPIMTVEELVVYTGFTKSYIYKLVHLKEIPFFKPQGKLLFFDREEINNWIRQNKSQSRSQMQSQALNYCLTSKKRG